jgi:RHS repeat-associated protein
VTIGAGSPTTTNYTYNTGNQISNSGYTYDANGNLTNDGTSAYTWDRANRLLNTGAAGANVSKYDGLGNRVSRTNSGFTTTLLNDLQPGLAQTVVIGFPSLGTTSRQAQTPMGVLAQKDPSGAWEWMLGDGLGNVRSVMDDMLTVKEHRHYEPYGSLYAGAMAETPFGFTGEWRDGGTGMYYLRARYYNPAHGAFVSRDPYEGTAARF